LSKVLLAASLATAVLLCHGGPALAAVPSNDDFDTATVVSSLPFSDTQDVSEATRAVDDPPTSGWPNVWYRFTPTKDTSLELDTTGSNTSTDVCVYQGVRGMLSQVVCSPDGFYSHFFAELKAGVTYHVMVEITGGCCNPALTFSLQDRTVANDDFDAAQQVDSLPFEDTRDVLRATAAADDPWCLQSSTNTVWYRYAPSTDVTIAADTLGSDYDTRLCVFYGSRGALNEVASNDDANNTFFASLRTNLQAGTTYWFEVATNQPGASNLHLSLQETAPLPRAANDDFDSATQIPSTPYTDTLDASGATPADDDPTDCYGTHGSVWYAYTAPAAGTVEVSTEGSDYDTALGVYEGMRGSLSQVGCDNDSTPTLAAQVSFRAAAGVTYFLMAVSPSGGTPGTLQLSLDFTPAPPPLTLTLSYDPEAVVDEQTGNAVATGTATCSRSAKATLVVSLSQQLGNSAPRAGTGKAVVVCSTKPTSHFAVAVVSTSSPGLSDGPANVRVVASACDLSSSCVKQSASGALQLVKKLK
jgi:hypothetical protein